MFFGKAVSCLSVALLYITHGGTCANILTRLILLIYVYSRYITKRIINWPGNSIPLCSSVIHASCQTFPKYFDTSTTSNTFFLIYLNKSIFNWGGHFKLCVAVLYMTRDKTYAKYFDTCNFSNIHLIHWAN